MKQDTTIFICDECKKTIKDKTEFPYENGWKYLYKINGKTDKEQSFKKRDKHFCSKKCMIKYIEGII